MKNLLVVLLVWKITWDIYRTLVPSSNIEFFYYKTSKSHFRLVVLSFSNSQDNILVLFKELEKIFLAISFKLPIKRKSYTQNQITKDIIQQDCEGENLTMLKHFFFTFQGNVAWHKTLQNRNVRITFICYLMRYNKTILLLYHNMNSMISKKYYLVISF